MCYRESFVLFPQETGIPVAWSVSYHHEDILRAANINKKIETHYYINNQSFDYVQIECTGGDVHKWDWDNTPVKEVRHMEYPEKPVWEGDSVPEMARYTISKEPNIPHWLEDNLHSYENLVEKILEQLNPVRDATEKLLNDLIMVHHTPVQYMITKPELSEYIKLASSDSREVKEFERIVNCYREIPGFVEEAPEEVLPEGYYDPLLGATAKQIYTAYGVSSNLIFKPLVLSKIHPVKISAIWVDELK